MKSTWFYRLASLSFLVCLLVWPAASQAQTDNQRERITSFDAQVTVFIDGHVRVIETIDYFFPSQRHGIFRDIPTHFRAEDGAEWEIPLRLVSVSSPTGAPAQYDLNRETNGIQIKIGDPDRTISGLHTYVITYEAAGALRYFEDHDELYWNVTGTEWRVPIEKSSATVTLPETIEVLATRCYTGARGSRAEDCERTTAGNQAEFAAAGNLTVVVGWPPDLVAELHPRKFNPWLASLWGLLFPGITFFLMYRHWKRHGRDAPINPTEVVQYEPPADMPPAEMGTLLDGTAHTVDIVSSIIDLAVRGYLKIREVKTKGLLFSSDDHELELIKADYHQDGQLKAYEVKILGTLFGTANKVRLSELKKEHVFSVVLPKIKQQLGSQLVFDGYYAKDPMVVRRKYMVVAGILVTLVWIGGSSVAMALLIKLTGSQLSGIALGLGGIVAIAIFALFGWFMPKLTAKGAAAVHHARGFKLYVSQAERYRLEWQEKENIFEKFLPYAMVFGVAKKWSAAFAGIEMEPPTWYEGSAFSAGAFNAAAFTSSFNAFTNSVNSAVLATPSKSGSGSGFSGGGFSGGGGGGGGGGSW
jgi:uncharacterized membrane protein